MQDEMRLHGQYFKKKKYSMATKGSIKRDALSYPSPISASEINYRIRLLLSATALVAYLIDAPPTLEDSVLKLSFLGGYVIYSAILFAAFQKYAHVSTGRLITWLDIAWYGLLIAFTDPLTSVLFLFFPFAILAASLRYGAKEGRLVTIASATTYVVVALGESIAHIDVEWTRLLLRTVFLVVLGFMIAGWGGTEASLKSRLTLLRKVTQLSNPRFGVDHTVSSLMDELKDFFEADSCLIVWHNEQFDTYSIRKTAQNHTSGGIHEEVLAADAGRLLLPLNNRRILLFRAPDLHWWHSQSHSSSYISAEGKWRKDQCGVGEIIAKVLDTAAYVSAPLQVRHMVGRLYISSTNKMYTEDDALFLNHIAVQAFSVIEKIELLDQIASEAAEQERQRIAGNLHDSTLQPYIGLQLGLMALRNKADAHNPLAADIDKLLKITDTVIGDLRISVQELRDTRTPASKALLPAIRRQATKFKTLYGITIDVQAEGNINVNDRLAAEVLQMVNEGLSNIRKHTSSQHGAVKLACEQGTLLLQIQNEKSSEGDATFTPRSITARAAALGGKAWVERAVGNWTTIWVSIPI